MKNLNEEMKAYKHFKKQQCHTYANTCKKSCTMDCSNSSTPHVALLYTTNENVNCIVYIALRTG